MTLYEAISGLRPDLFSIGIDPPNYIDKYFEFLKEVFKQVVESVQALHEV